MKVHYASIGHKPETVNDYQMIPPEEWTTVRFPYGGEFSDEHGMHTRRHPDAYVVQDWSADGRSGYLWPSIDGVGCLELNLHWQAGDYEELRDQFGRVIQGEPLDTTATDHRPPTKGMQCFTKSHWLKVDRRTPLVLRVGHDDSEPRGLIMAQFKLTIFA